MHALTLLLLRAFNVLYMHNAFQNVIRNYDPSYETIRYVNVAINETCIANRNAKQYAVIRHAENDPLQNATRHPNHTTYAASPPVLPHRPCITHRVQTYQANTPRFPKLGRLMCLPKKFQNQIPIFQQNSGSNYHIPYGGMALVGRRRTPQVVRIKSVRW